MACDKSILADCLRWERRIIYIEWVKHVTDIRAKQREKNKQEARASLEAQNGQSASSDGLNSEVLNNPGLQQLAMVGQMQQELIKKNTINGKMRMCTIDTKEPGLILEGTKDGKFRFEKESDKSVVEIDPENLELCQDK